MYSGEVKHVMFIWRISAITLSIAIFWIVIINNNVLAFNLQLFTYLEI